MTTLNPDPLATAVHLHIAALRQEAAGDRAARAARAASRARDGARAVRRPSWPEPVARALRETFARAASRPACPTC